MKDVDFKTTGGRGYFYGTKEWKTLRRYKLSLNPLCEHCKKEDIIKYAIDVDHIIDIQDDPSKRLDITNLQSLCKECHGKKTYGDHDLVEKKQKINTFEVYKQKWKT